MALKGHGFRKSNQPQRGGMMLARVVRPGCKREKDASRFSGDRVFLTAPPLRRSAAPHPSIAIGELG